MSSTSVGRPARTFVTMRSSGPMNGMTAPETSKARPQRSCRSGSRRCRQVGQEFSEAGCQWHGGPPRPVDEPRGPRRAQPRLASLASSPSHGDATDRPSPAVLPANSTMSVRSTARSHLQASDGCPPECGRASRSAPDRYQQVAPQPSPSSSAGRRSPLRPGRAPRVRAAACACVAGGV